MAPGIHWLAPVMMSVTLCGGIGIAVGHHFFYQHLDGTVATDAAYSIFGSISTQEAYIAIGIAFAFSFKASLVFATSLAFLQLFWREAKAVNGRTPAKLKTLDSLHSSLSNVFTMFNLPIWWRYPLLFLMAMTTW